MPQVAGAVGQHTDGVPVDLKPVFIRLDDGGLAGPAAEKIVGWQGLALDGLVHQRDLVQCGHGLLHTGAPAQKPGQQTARMDGGPPRSGGLFVHGVLRIVKQGAHKTGAVNTVHQNGFPKAQHRHACVAVPPRPGASI